ncbi:MAG: hypothetical protein V4509_00630 [Patescibacteria group bacterium]
MTRESKWQTLWNKYLREKQDDKAGYGFYELKQTTGDSLDFKKIEVHQYESLLAAEKAGLVWKFSDQDQRQKPFDCVSIPPISAFIVIKFPDAFYVIKIKDMIKEKETSLRKSLTKDRARELAVKVIHI